jgi:hypothetical protein
MSRKYNAYRSTSILIENESVGSSFFFGISTGAVLPSERACFKLNNKTLSIMNSIKKCYL